MEIESDELEAPHRIELREFVDLLSLDAETLARTIADTSGVLVSAGRHCAHELHEHCGADATLRISAWLVNDLDDIARCFDALRPLIA